MKNVMNPNIAITRAQALTNILTKQRNDTFHEIFRV